MTGTDFAFIYCCALASLFGLGFAIGSASAAPLRAQWVNGDTITATVEYDTAARLVRIREAPLFADSFE